jgi:hypothetical protein
MPDKWYFAWDGNRQGPFSAGQLKDLAEQGKLQPRDTVWKEGIEDGVRAEQIQNLFPAPQAETLPETASPSAADEPLSSLRPSKGLSSRFPNQVAKLEPWLSSSHDQGIPQEQHGTIAEGLTLKEIDDNDSTDSVSAVKETAAPASPDGASTRSYPPTASLPKKKGRAVAARGAVLISQDGQNVQYRKKCLKCGHEDASRCVAPIRNGLIRGTFYCRKCRKASVVEIQCVL